MQYDLSAIVEQRTEALGGENVEFTFGGETFTMPHPLLADDAWKEAINDAGDSDVENARAMLGDEQYERFLAAGGRSGYVMLLVQKLVDDTQDSVGERPTQSSKSSGTTRKRQKQR